jgi:HEAT repeat protein
VYFPSVIARQLPSPKHYEKQLSFSVAVALSHIGTKAIPQLIRLSDDANPEVKTAAIEALRMVDPEAAKLPSPKQARK